MSQWLGLILATTGACGAAALWWMPRAVVRTRLPRATIVAASRASSWLVLAGAGLAVVALFDGVVSALLAVAAVVVVRRWQRSADSREQRGAATERALALPVVLDVLAACVTMGASQREALRAVASSSRGTLRNDLEVVSDAMRLGADAEEAWSLIDAPDLRALGAMLTRSENTGAPLGPLLVLLADQHRQRARAAAMDAARTLGVRLSGPLGLCFLPAFVAVAVVPLVISLLPFR